MASHMIQDTLHHQARRMNSVGRATRSFNRCVASAQPAIPTPLAAISSSLLAAEACLREANSSSAQSSGTSMACPLPTDYSAVVVDRDLHRIAAAGDALQTLVNVGLFHEALLCGVLFPAAMRQKGPRLSAYEASAWSGQLIESAAGLEIDPAGIHADLQYAVRCTVAHLQRGAISDALATWPSMMSSDGRRIAIDVSTSFAFPHLQQHMSKASKLTTSSNSVFAMNKTLGMMFEASARAAAALRVSAANSLRAQTSPAAESLQTSQDRDETALTATAHISTRTSAPGPLASYPISIANVDGQSSARLSPSGSSYTLQASHTSYVSHTSYISLSNVTAMTSRPVTSIIWERIKSNGAVSPAATITMFKLLVNSPDPADHQTVREVIATLLTSRRPWLPLHLRDVVGLADVAECVSLAPALTNALVRACIVIEDTPRLVRVLQHAERGMLVVRRLQSLVKACGYSNTDSNTHEKNSWMQDLAAVNELRADELECITTGNVSSLSLDAKKRVGKAAFAMLSCLQSSAPHSFHARYSDMHSSTLQAIATYALSHHSPELAVVAYRWHLRGVLEADFNNAATTINAPQNMHAFSIALAASSTSKANTAGAHAVDVSLPVGHDWQHSLLNVSNGKISKRRVKLTVSDAAASSANTLNWHALGMFTHPSNPSIDMPESSVPLSETAVQALLFGPNGDNISQLQESAAAFAGWESAEVDTTYKSDVLLADAAIQAYNLLGKHVEAACVWQACSDSALLMLPHVSQSAQPRTPDIVQQVSDAASDAGLMLTWNAACVPAALRSLAAVGDSWGLYRLRILLLYHQCAFMLRRQDVQRALLDTLGMPMRHDIRLMPVSVQSQVFALPAYMFTPPPVAKQHKEGDVVIPSFCKQVLANHGKLPASSSSSEDNISPAYWMQVDFTHLQQLLTALGSSESVSSAARRSLYTAIMRVIGGKHASYLVQFQAPHAQATVAAHASSDVACATPRFLGLTAAQWLPVAFVWKHTPTAMDVWLLSWLTDWRKFNEQHLGHSFVSRLSGTLAGLQSNFPPYMAGLTSQLSAFGILSTKKLSALPKNDQLRSFNTSFLATLQRGSHNIAFLQDLAPRLMRSTFLLCQAEKSDGPFRLLPLASHIQQPPSSASPAATPTACACVDARDNLTDLLHHRLWTIHATILGIAYFANQVALAGKHIHKSIIHKNSTPGDDPQRQLTIFPLRQQCTQVFHQAVVAAYMIYRQSLVSGFPPEHLFALQSHRLLIAVATHPEGQARITTLHEENTEDVEVGGVHSSYSLEKLIEDSENIIVATRENRSFLSCQEPKLRNDALIMSCALYKHAVETGLRALGVYSAANAVSGVVESDVKLSRGACLPNATDLARIAVLGLCQPVHEASSTIPVLHSSDALWSLTQWLLGPPNFCNKQQKYTQQDVLRIRGPAMGAAAQVFMHSPACMPLIVYHMRHKRAVTVARLLAFLETPPKHSIPAAQTAPSTQNAPSSFPYPSLSSLPTHDEAYVAVPKNVMKLEIPEVKFLGGKNIENERIDPTQEASAAVKAWLTGIKVATTEVVDAERADDDDVATEFGDWKGLPSVLQEEESTLIAGTHTDNINPTANECFAAVPDSSVALERLFWHCKTSSQHASIVMLATQCLRLQLWLTPAAASVVATTVVDHAPQLLPVLLTHLQRQYCVTTTTITTAAATSSPVCGTGLSDATAYSKVVRFLTSQGSHDAAVLVAAQMLVLPSAKDSISQAEWQNLANTAHQMGLGVQARKFRAVARDTVAPRAVASASTATTAAANNNGAVTAHPTLTFRSKQHRGPGTSNTSSSSSNYYAPTTSTSSTTTLTSTAAIASAGMSVDAALLTRLKQFDPK